MIKIWDVKENSFAPLQFDFYDSFSSYEHYLEDNNTFLYVYNNKSFKLWNTNFRTPLVNLQIDGELIVFDSKKRELYIQKKTQIVKYKLYKDLNLSSEYFLLKTEVETGFTLDDMGEVKALSASEWQKKKKKWEERLKELHIEKSD